VLIDQTAADEVGNRPHREHRRSKLRMRRTDAIKIGYSNPSRFLNHD